MSRARLASRLAAAIGLAAVAGVLSGCISLLPKSPPAQLYRFDVRGAAAAPASDDALRAAVVAPPVTVARAAASDRLLTVTGDQAAYIAGARWISPAVVLWDETVRRAFEARATRVRLLARGELAGGAAFLRLDVPEFEARYAAAGSSPTVHVALHALYTHRDGSFVAEHAFTADVPAAEDRVSAIVSAYDEAVTGVVGQLLAWADAHAADAAATPPASAVTRSVTSTSAPSTVRRP